MEITVMKVIHSESWNVHNSQINPFIYAMVRIFIKERKWCEKRTRELEIFHADAIVSCVEFLYCNFYAQKGDFLFYLRFRLSHPMELSLVLRMLIVLRWTAEERV